LKDWTVERDEFELPVRFPNNQTTTRISGLAAPRRIVGIAGGSIAGSAYQHSKKTFPSYTMNDIADETTSRLMSQQRSK
jgi:hypothetical protein